MKQKIYIVEGSTGEYSDHREWLVAAYYSEQNAQAHVLRATQRANELYVEHKDAYYNIPSGANQHDPQMSSDYTGTRYNYYETELLDEPNEKS
jgi:hypothetical protein